MFLAYKESTETKMQHILHLLAIKDVSGTKIRISVPECWSITPCMGDESALHRLKNYKVSDIYVKKNDDYFSFKYVPSTHSQEYTDRMFEDFSISLTVNHLPGVKDIFDESLSNIFCHMLYLKPHERC